MYVKWCWLSGLGGVFFIYMMTWPPETKNPNIDMYDGNIVRTHQINLMKFQQPGPANVLKEKLLRKNLKLKKYKSNIFEYMQGEKVNSDARLEYLKDFIEYYNYIVFMAVVAGAGAVFLTLPNLREYQWPLLSQMKSKILGLPEIDTDVENSQDLKEALERIKEVEWESAVLLAQRAQWKSECDTLKKYLETVNREKKELQNQLVAVQDVVKDVRRELEAIKIEQALTASKLEDSQKDFKSIMKKKQFTVKQLENARKENLILHEQISFLSNEKESVERRLNLIEDELWKMKISQTTSRSNRDRERTKIAIESRRLQEKYGSETVEVGSIHSRGSIQISAEHSDIQVVDIEEEYSERNSEISSRSEGGSIHIQVENKLSDEENSFLSNSSWSTCELTHGYGDISSVTNTIGDHSSGCSICDKKKCDLEHDMCENVECLRNCKQSRYRKASQMKNESKGNGNSQTNDPSSDHKSMLNRKSFSCLNTSRSDPKRKEKDRPDSAPLESDMSGDSYTDQLDLLKQILENSGIAEARSRKIQSAPDILDPSGTPRPVTGSPAFHLFLRGMRNLASEKHVDTLQSHMEFEYVVDVTKSKTCSEGSSWKIKSRRSNKNYIPE